MRLAVRWTAVLLVVAALVALWLRDASTPNSDPAGPREQSLADVAAQQSVSELAESSQPDANAPGVRAEALPPQLSAYESTAETALIRVRVVAKETGAPVVGELIAAQPVGVGKPSNSPTNLPHGKLGEAQQTDADGRAELTVLARRAHKVFLFRTAKLNSLDTPALEPGAVHECELATPTQADVVFVGRVIDGETRAPIADAKIVPHEWSGQSLPPAFGLIRSAHDGYFELRAKSWERTLAHVEARGYAWVAVDVVQGFESRAKPLDVPLFRAATAEVVVVMQDRRVAGAEIVLSADSYQLQAQTSKAAAIYAIHEDPVWRASTDGLGVARLEGLPAGVRFEMQLKSAGVTHMQSDPLYFEPGVVRRIEVRIGAGVVVRGRLETSAGEPVADAELWRVAWQGPTPVFLSPEDEAVALAATDKHGRFAFEAVGAGQWAIGPAPQSFGSWARGLAPLAQPVVVRGDEGAIDLVLRTDRDLYIRGHVLRADGAPARSEVSAFNKSLGLWMSADSDDDGSFEVGPLVQADFEVVAGRSGVSASSPAVTAPAGAEGLVVRLEAPGSLIVRSAPVNGETVDASVTMIRAGSEFGWMRSNTGGGFRRFDDVMPGTYSVVLRTDDGLFALRRGVEVRAGGPPTEVELALRAGASVEVSYEGADVGCQCSLLVDGTVVDFTGVRRGGVGYLLGPPGTLEVQRHTGVNTPPEVHVLTLAPGEKRKLVLGK